MLYVYPCALVPEEDGGFSVSFPDVPEALTCGNDRADALAMAEDALAVALGAYMKCREDIPVPSPAAVDQVLVAVPPIVAAKLALYFTGYGSTTRKAAWWNSRSCMRRAGGRWTGGTAVR